MIDWNIDKQYVLNKFTKWLGAVGADDDDRSDDPTDRSKKKSRWVVLNEIIELYKFVLDVSMLSLRNHYIDNDDAFKKVKSALVSYIKNKIRSKSDGTIYLDVPDLVTFDGSVDQYYEWVTNDKGKRIRLIRRIIDDLNSMLSGNAEEDENRPVLFNRNMTEEHIVHFVLEMMIPEAYLQDVISGGSPEEFTAVFLELGNRYGFDKEKWEIIKDNVLSVLIPEQEEVIEESEPETEERDSGQDETT